MPSAQTELGRSAGQPKPGTLAAAKAAEPSAVQLAVSKSRRSRPVTAPNR